MMKMDGRDSAECQNWEKKGQNGHFDIVEVRKRQKLNIVISLIQRPNKKNVLGEKGLTVAMAFEF